MSSTSADAQLVCPRCAAAHPTEERFCRECGVPLVLAGGGESERPSESVERARKILPRFARGEAQRVAVGRNLAEAELMQGMLLEEGIPSILKRSGGFDVPDFLAAGPRDVFVPASGVEAARELLQTSAEEAPTVAAADDRSPRIALKLLAGMFIFLLIFTTLASLLWVLTN